MSKKAGAIIMLAGAGAYFWTTRSAQGYAVVSTQPGASDPFQPSQPPPQTSNPFDFSWLGNVSNWFSWPSSQPNGETTTMNNPTVNYPGVSVPVPRPKPTPTPTVNNPGVSNAVLTMARTIYGEARGEPYSGKVAVANVIMNRVRSYRYPSTVEGVCLQPWQFSCWNANDPNSGIIANLQPGANGRFDTCLSIAQKAVSGALSDNTGGALHYHADYLDEVSWVKNSPNARMSARIGRHMFFVGIA
ncbi:cell wall hydrolase [Pseudovibrio ascidiaceicola]|uniref:cell wall hydrolase n=1 Tax=Pseudovibrio ascidiaceicola TaxID=285279 RepID=UPI000D68891E|nr:cell wall hydrolase [Pseudovibrio ascidiaceicola]